MHQFSMAPLVGMIPTALLAAEEAMNGTPWDLVTQLGIGGVLVGFAVWLQDKFAAQGRKDAQQLRDEMAAMIARHDAVLAAEVAKHDSEIEAERKRHETTRSQFITLLSAKKDPTS